MGFLCVVPVAAFIAIKQKRRIEQTLAVSIFGIILLILDYSRISRESG